MKTQTVVTYSILPHGTTDLCDDCSETHDGVLGQVQHGAHDGECDDCTTEES